MSEPTTCLHTRVLGGSEGYITSDAQARNAARSRSNRTAGLHDRVFHTGDGCNRLLCCRALHRSITSEMCRYRSVLPAPTATTRIYLSR
jgi:hypothetical protein